MRLDEMVSSSTPTKAEMSSSSPLAESTSEMRRKPLKVRSRRSSEKVRISEKSVVARVVFSVGVAMSTMSTMSAAHAARTHLNHRSAVCRSQPLAARPPFGVGGGERTRHQTDEINEGEWAERPAHARARLG
jgi:hypothetical protein